MLGAAPFVVLLLAKSAVNLVSLVPGPTSRLVQTSPSSPQGPPLPARGDLHYGGQWARLSGPCAASGTPAFQVRRLRARVLSLSNGQASIFPKASFRSSSGVLTEYAF